MRTFELNDGHSIPSIGFGVFRIENDGPTYDATLKALTAGYRLIDTAAAYMNETDVGKAIKDSGIPREEIYLTSKLWLQDYGYENAKKGIETSLQNLGVDYIDLYLLHQPYGDTVGAWKALEEAVEEGKIRSIGISNHTIKLFKALYPSMKILPAVNQVECNPLFQQKELKEYMNLYGIRLEAWFPLGHGNKALLENKVLTALAAKYNKDVVQIILKWHQQEGIIALPKSTNEAHIISNIDIFDFELSDDDMAKIRNIDTNQGTHNPEDMSNAERLSKLKIHD